MYIISGGTSKRNVVLVELIGPLVRMACLCPRVCIVRTKHLQG